MDLDKAIKERHSVRSFKTTKHADWRDIIKAIDAARLAPLAGNISTTRFILVTEEDLIEKIADACTQDFVKDVKFIVVVCSDDSQAGRSYDERSEKYCRQQAGAAIENFLLKIADLGLASCWIGAFADDMVKTALKIPDNIKVEAIFPIGYEFKKTKQKPKLELEHVLFFNQWKNKYMKPVRKPEAL